MKIINVFNGRFEYSGQGGGVRYVRNLIKVQNTLGLNVMLLCIGNGEVKKIYIDNVSVIIVPITDRDEWPFFLLALAMHFFKRRKKYRGVLIHLHRVYFSPATWCLKDSKVVVTIHTKTFDVLVKRFRIARNFVPLLVLLERILILGFVDDLSVSGESIRQLYMRRHSKVGRKVALLPGFTGEEFEGSFAPVINQSRIKRLITVGRLSPVKRPTEVLKLFEEAVYKNPELRGEYELVFIGAGELEKDLRTMVADKGLSDCVKLLGEIDANIMPQLYESAHRLILLSESESGPYVLKEALCKGIPVFCTNVGIAKDLVTSDVGKLIPVDLSKTNSTELIKFLRKDFDRSVCKLVGKRFIEKEREFFVLQLRDLYQNGLSDSNIGV